MTHLTPTQLVEALDGALESDRKHHLDSCRTCEGQLADLGAVLGETRDLNMPEPSPLFWQHLSDRVGTAVDAESLVGDWPVWLRWPVMAPVAALALLMMTLAVAVPRQARVATNGATHVAVDETSDSTLDDSWVIVADLVGDLDWDTAMLVGLTLEPGAADLAVLQLTAAEQRELTRLLKAELTRAKS